tara:strand:- start:131 stop:619 length:489 start_codon:yes stop_codon:yes gene_type:complete
MEEYFTEQLFSEEGEGVSPGYELLREYMQEALETGASEYSGATDPEADRYRHIMGMRAAAMDPNVGRLRALLGGAGHEINNLYDAFLRGELKNLGTNQGRLSTSQILQNSYDDMYNNLVGIMSVGDDLGEMPMDEYIMELLQRGRVPIDLRVNSDSGINSVK